MSNPIDGGAGATGPQNVLEADATEDAGSVEETADAFRTAVSDATAVEDLGPVQGIAMEIAGKLQAGEVDPYEALELLVEGMANARFAALDDATRTALTTHVRDSLMSDSFFVMELEQLLGAALARVS